MSWTDDRIERLLNLWRRGLSASTIAAELGGVSRNAVTGQLYRLGCSKRVAVKEKPAAARKDSRAPMKKVQAVRAATSVKAEDRPPIVAKPKAQPVASSSSAESSEFVTLLERKSSQCAFPVGVDGNGDQLYCGKDNHDGRDGYCLACTTKMYRNTPKIALQRTHEVSNVRLHRRADDRTFDAWLEER